MNLTIDEVRLPAAGELALEDKWILTRFEHLTAAVRENIDSYELGVALGKIYDFVWDIFCDWYIELVKPPTSPQATRSRRMLSHMFSPRRSSCCIRSCRSLPRRYGRVCRMRARAL